MNVYIETLDDVRRNDPNGKELSVSLEEDGPSLIEWAVALSINLYIEEIEIHLHGIIPERNEVIHLVEQFKTRGNLKGVHIQGVWNDADVVGRQQPIIELLAEATAENPSTQSIDLRSVQLSMKTLFLLCRLDRDDIGLGDVRVTGFNDDYQIKILKLGSVRRLTFGGVSDETTMRAISCLVGALQVQCVAFSCIEFTGPLLRCIMDEEAVSSANNSALLEVHFLLCTTHDEASSQMFVSLCRGLPSQVTLKIYCDGTTTLASGTAEHILPPFPNSPKMSFSVSKSATQALVARVFRASTLNSNLESIAFLEEIKIDGNGLLKLVAFVAGMKCKELCFTVQSSPEALELKPRFIAALQRNPHVCDVSGIDPYLRFFTAEEKQSLNEHAACNRTRLLREFMRAAYPIGGKFVEVKNGIRTDAGTLILADIQNVHEIHENGRDVLFGPPTHFLAHRPDQYWQWQANNSLATSASVSRHRDPFIGLDVGGHRPLFCCRVSTLTKGSPYFARLFNNDITQHEHYRGKDERGRDIYCVDRKGAVFEYVLEYLRNSNEMDLSDIPEDPRLRKSLRREAKFYEIDGLLSILDEAQGQHQ